MADGSFRLSDSEHGIWFPLCFVWVADKRTRSFMSSEWVKKHLNCFGRAKNKFSLKRGHSAVGCANFKVSDECLICLWESNKSRVQIRLKGECDRRWLTRVYSEGVAGFQLAHKSPQNGIQPKLNSFQMFLQRVLICSDHEMLSSRVFHFPFLKTSFHISVSFFSSFGILLSSTDALLFHSKEPVVSSWGDSEIS